jgi:hypothetical protein
MAVCGHCGFRGVLARDEEGQPWCIFCGWVEPPRRAVVREGRHSARLARTGLGRSVGAPVRRRKARVAA